MNMLKKKQEEFQGFEKELTHLKEKIKQTHRQETKKSFARMFTGIEGVKQIFRHELELGKNYLVIGAPKESLDSLGMIFWKNFLTKQKSKGMKGRLIFNDSLREYAKEIENPQLNTIRFLKDAFEPLTEIIIYNRYVATIIWSQEVLATLIESEEVAKSYTKYFELLWKQTLK